MGAGEHRGAGSGLVSAPLRAAVVGARRCRQGTGEYIARELHLNGCEVRAIVGTQPETIEAARQALADRHGIECRGYDSLEALLEREQVDLVAVCSPATAHLRQVEQAAQADCHVLCEKPLWWDPEVTRQADLAERARALVARFQSRDRYLALNAQWPYTLDAYRSLFPDAYGEGRPVTSLSLHLSPTSVGTEAVVASGSHLLSMLQALVGAGTVQDERVIYHVADGSDLEVSFVYSHADGATSAALRLVRCLEPPRPAGYAINGFSAQRTVELDSYRISFDAQGRSVPVKDPLASCVADFVAGVRAGRRPDQQALVAGMTQLQQLARAAEKSRP